MAFSLNRAQIIGNLTRDPELRQTSTGQTVASFAVATNSVWTDKTGNKQEKAEFHNIVAWAKLAEICGNFLHKGRKVYVEGRIQTRDWDGEDGVKRYRTEIVAENLILLDKAGAPQEGVERSQRPVREETPQNTTQPVEVAAEEVTLDDLPF